MNQMCLAILFVWLQAFLVWAAGGSPYVPTTIASLVALQILGCPPLRMSGRTTLGLLTAAGLILACARLSQPAAIVAEDALPAFLLLSAEFLLLWHAMLVLRLPRDGALPGYFPALGVATFMCAFQQTMDPSQRGMYLALAIGCATLCGALWQATARRGGVARTREVGAHRMIMGCVLLCGSLGAWAAAGAWETAVARVQVLLPGWIGEIAGHNRAARNYVRSGALRSITAEKETDPMHVALWVYAERLPGYLRGRVFDTYDQSQWHMGPDRRRRKWDWLDDKHVSHAVEQPPAGVARPLGGQRLFPVAPSSAGELLPMEIHNDPQRGEIYFTPLATRYVQGEGTYLAIDDHGAIHGGITTDAPYTAYFSRETPREVLAGPLRERLLAPPGGVDPDVFDLAEEVCSGAETAQQKIGAVVAFFQDNFAYSDERMDLPSGVEPLSFFLMQRPAAHCEFFASGAVTLLRHQGVPSRYVTGYLVKELEGEYGDYWLARNRNAHAWAEAYDDATQRWVVVEATPGMYVPHDTDSLADAQARIANSIEDEHGETAARDPWSRRRWLGRRWEWLGARLMFPLLVSGVCLFSWLVWYQLRSRAQRSRRTGDPRVAGMRRMLRQMDRRLRRAHLVRRPHETLHQFAGRVSRASADNARLRGAADWYLRYARVRYSGGGPQKPGLDALRRMDAR